ncbi:hypothetical protein KQ876_00010 [Mycoplasma sp. CSL7491-lung]|uniref:HinT-interacting membrane complex protein P80 n=1 Tax=Mycoplasma sp. CSL7491-lung TaxID=549718 RepID=UPI001C1183A7|nr:hypothetical protein [Mycoplasma sp. CSL7491-lung]MBU4692593.1 hypothetical protein [Mycoplasma sp. CSL7491-lung]
MAKGQKSFFERLTEVNDSYDEKKQNKNTTNKKKRNYINIAILSTLGVGAFLGITIPAVINSTKVNYEQPTKDDVNVLEFKNSNGVVTKINVKELTNVLTDTSKTNQSKVSSLYKKIILEWYKQEQRASQIYEHIFNNSLIAGETVRSDIKLKKIEDIEKEQKAKIDEERNNIQKKYPFQTWEKAFLEKLQSDEFGKSNTVEEATEYLVFKEIENEALRRFTIEVKTYDLNYINRVAQRDIYDIDEFGNTLPQKLLFHKGDKVFSFYKENENYYTDSSVANKAVTFTTRSFIDKLKDPTELINTYFSSNSLMNVESIILPGAHDPELTKPFKFDDKSKEKLINLLSYSSIIKTTTNNGNPTTSREFIQNVELFKKFKAASEYSLIKENQTSEEFQYDKTLYSSYIESLTLTKSDSLLKSALVTFKDLFTSNQEQALGIIAKDELSKGDKKIPEINLNEIYKLPTGVNSSLESEIDKLQKELKTMESQTNNEQEFIEKTTLLNSYISRLINSMDNAQFEKWIKDTFNNHFNINVDNKNYVSTVYKVKDKDGYYALLNATGINLFKVTMVQEKDQYIKMFKDDMINVLKGFSTHFDLVNKINKKLSEEQIVVKALQDDGLKAALKNIDNPSITDKKEKYNDQVLEEYSNIAYSISNGKVSVEITNNLDKIDKWIKDTYNSETNLNLSYKDAKMKVAYYDTTNKTFSYSEESAFDLYESALRKMLKQGEDK